MHPLVTISIPLYKCEEFLKACLESVQAQTYPNIEVTLINDQTSDNSVEIAESFINDNDLKNWRIYHLEKNSGLSVVRNKGIDTAQGKYLFFLDSDDEISLNAIELMVEIAEAEQVEMVVGDVDTIDANTGLSSEIFSSKTRSKKITGNCEILQHFVDGKYPTSSWNKLVLLNFLKENKLYFTPGLFAQDALQSFQTALKLNSIGFLHKKTYRYYLHENSVIHNRKKEHFDNWFTIASLIDISLKSKENRSRKNLILKHLIEFKNITLIMNWKAQKNETLWKESYSNYKTLTSLSLMDYFSNNFSMSVKKINLFNQLPTELGFRLFKWRYER